MSSYEPGSRAITIPLHSNSLRAATTRRTRTKAHERTDSSEAGPSSLSSRDSSWSSPAASAHALRHKPLRKPAYRHLVPDNAMHMDEEYQSSDRKTKDKSQKGDPPETPQSSPPSQMPVHIHNSPLGPSMIASSSYKSINLSSHNDPDEPPRLITYTKHSQGFTWNDELFLPGYLLGRYGGSRRRRHRWDDDDDEQMDAIMDSNDPERCPVTEIFVTDEEAAAMMP